jgi:hypothetical protein
MPFDLENQSPVVNVKRRTTKVNISIVVGVLLFFIAAAIVTWRISTRPPQHADESRMLDRP